MEKDIFCMPIPINSISCCNYRDAFGDIVFRIIEIPDNTFIAQNKKSSLSFTDYKSAEQFLFTFNH